jgi:hypothetical protein
MVPSILPNIAEFLMALNVNYPIPTRTWLESLLAQEGFPTPQVTLQDKKNFVQSILAARQLRKCKEAVKTFSLKCRGLQGTEFGKAFM